jgi:CheY-like chemotaxis protein
MVLVSPFAQRERAMALARPGVDGCINKPVRRVRLLTALDTVLVGAHLDRATPVPPRPTEGQFAGSHVLLVEDNAVNQKLAETFLKRAGCSCDIAPHGRAAVDALERRRYDLVLMDCQMPEMDGFEATQEIRRRESGRTRTTIIALTAGALPEDRARALAAGMDDYLTKPVSYGALTEMLSKHLVTCSG